MKFNFRLDVLKRQRKIDQDEAQREYATAQKNVRDQLARIESMYKKIDDARLLSDQLQATGGTCSGSLKNISSFIANQKTRITNERLVARELMAIEEEKHEILIKKMQDHKVLENLKAKKKEEHKKLMNKKEIKKTEDIVTMNFNFERKV